MLEKYKFSKAGNGHENEDEIRIKEHPEQQNVIICSLADGQGGQFGGGKAAKVAVEKSLELSISHSVNELAKKDIWKTIFQQTDNAVCNDKDAGYTTLVSLCVINEWVYGCSVGDSAAMAISGSKKYTLTENQYKNPPIGSSGAEPVFFSLKLAKPWKLVVVSDGVWKYAGWNFVFNTLSSENGNDIIEKLFDHVFTSNNKYLPDDFSIALFQDT